MQNVAGNGCGLVEGKGGWAEDLLRKVFGSSFSHEVRTPQKP